MTAYPLGLALKFLLALLLFVWADVGRGDVDARLVERVLWQALEVLVAAVEPGLVLDPPRLRRHLPMRLGKQIPIPSHHIRRR